jgi:DNA-binding transcriptional LysR family regulator
MDRAPTGPNHPFEQPRSLVAPFRIHERRVIEPAPTGGAFHGVTDQALARIGTSRRVTVSVTSFLVLPEILRNSDLIAVVPRRLALHAEGLVLREPPVEILGFSMAVAWHERTHHCGAAMGACDWVAGLKRP